MAFSNRIIRIAKEHSRKVKECGKTLAQLVELWVKGDIEESKKRYDLLVEIEADADKIKNSMIKETAEADALGVIGKEFDFSSIILQADGMIDYAEGVGQRLLNCTWRKLPDIVTEKAIELSEIIMVSMKLIRDAFFALSDTPDKTLKICNEIDKYERKSDISFRELEKILYSDDLKDVNLRKILPFLDAMEHLEDIGDISENVADSLKILYIAKFGIK